MSDPWKRRAFPNRIDGRAGFRRPDPWSRTQAGDIASHRATSETVINRFRNPPVQGATCVSRVGISVLFTRSILLHAQFSANSAKPGHKS
jgi:hypothetical protein